VNRLVSVPDNKSRAGWKILPPLTNQKAGWRNVASAAYTSLTGVGGLPLGRRNGEEL